MRLRPRRLFNRVYLLEIDDSYALAMHFLRFQEYYEGIKYRRKIFTILEYQEWYARSHGGVFSYCVDWSGFNIPSWAILDLAPLIPDRNPYDDRMIAMAEKIRARQGDNFYLIGASSVDPLTLQHEMAHGLFATDSPYASEVLGVVNEIPRPTLKKMFEFLGGKQYHPAVYRDEINAFVSTDPPRYRDSPSRYASAPLKKKLRSLLAHHLDLAAVSSSEST